jgi:hypothetical protein
MSQYLQDWVALCDFVELIYKLCLSLENRKPNRYMKMKAKERFNLEYIIERGQKTFFKSLLLRILQFY